MISILHMLYSLPKKQFEVAGHIFPIAIDQDGQSVVQVTPSVRQRGIRRCVGEIRMYEAALWNGLATGRPCELWLQLRDPDFSGSILERSVLKHVITALHGPQHLNNCDAQVEDKTQHSISHYMIDVEMLQDMEHKDRASGWKISRGSRVKSAHMQAVRSVCNSYTSRSY